MDWDIHYLGQSPKECTPRFFCVCEHPSVSSGSCPEMGFSWQRPNQQRTQPKPAHKVPTFLEALFFFCCCGFAKGTQTQCPHCPAHRGRGTADPDWDRRSTVALHQNFCFFLKFRSLIILKDLRFFGFFLAQSPSPCNKKDLQGSELLLGTKECLSLQLPTGLVGPPALHPGSSNAHRFLLTIHLD